MDNGTTVGIDLAKNVFSVHGVDAAGAVRVRKTVSRGKLMELVARLPPCLIGLEACSGAHELSGGTPTRPAVQFMDTTSADRSRQHSANPSAPAPS